MTDPSKRMYICSATSENKVSREKTCMPKTKTPPVEDEKRKTKNETCMEFMSLHVTGQPQKSSEWARVACIASSNSEINGLKNQIKTKRVSGTQNEQGLTAVAQYKGGSKIPSRLETLSRVTKIPRRHEDVKPLLAADRSLVQQSRPRGCDHVRDRRSRREKRTHEPRVRITLP